VKRSGTTRLHYLMLVPGVGVILFFIATTVLVTVARSFGLFSITGTSDFTLKHWAVIATREARDSVLFSLKMGVLASVGTVLVAFPVALFFRKGGTGKRTLGSLIKIPLFIPALVAAFLIVNLISYHGVVNEVLIGLHLIKEPLRMLNDPFGWGVVFIQIWKNLPFVLLILSASLAGIHDDVVDAARNLGAGTWAVVLRVYVPLAMSGILVSMILMFIKAFGDFPIYGVAGPIYPPSISYRMHTTATIFQQWDQAAVLGVIIIVTALFVVWAYSRLAEIAGGTE
jgi:putative spermidine/putrescine transport system permease protein